MDQGGGSGVREDHRQVFVIILVRAGMAAARHPAHLVTPHADAFALPPAGVFGVETTDEIEVNIRVAFGLVEVIGAKTHDRIGALLQVAIADADV